MIRAITIVDIRNKSIEELREIVAQYERYKAEKEGKESTWGFFKKFSNFIGCLFLYSDYVSSMKSLDAHYARDELKRRKYHSH